MQAIRWLRELIALPSVNPAFVASGNPLAGEHRVVDYVAGIALKLGLDVEREEVFPGRCNLLARLRPLRQPRRRILLAPHTDTVGGAPTQFQPEQRGGRIHGRGACDTKGSLAAMLWAMAQLAKSRRRPQDTEIILAALVDEENGQAGSRALAASGLKADLAIVGEPTRLELVTAHKGDLWLQLETRGKAAHGARPELGDNAVHRMARVVDLFETTYARALRHKRHPLLGRATVSIGSIAGGTQPNVVPDRCVASADRRTLPGETQAGVLREIRTVLRTHRLEAAVVDAKPGPCPPLETNPRLPWVRQFMAVLGQRRPVGVDFFCDAAILAQAGIPSVVFGPGDIAQAHTAREWVSTAGVERAARALGRFLESLP